MKIAQIAPLQERVPPQGYGGIERVVADLCDGLIKRGHEVALFASGDSKTKVHLVSVYPRAIRTDKKVRKPFTLEFLNIVNAFEKAEKFDIIHNHTGELGIMLCNFIKTPIVTTLHGIFTPENKRVFRRYKNMPFVSISNNQRKGMPSLNYIATVYNGIDVNDFKLDLRPKNYLLFLGRCSPLKGAHIAIEVAKRCKMKLIMASKIDKVDIDYYEQKVKPHIDGKNIQFFGELAETQRVNLFKDAKATLFPITWEEPFGLVMTESMATGTPVIAFKMGAVPEVIKNGKTGFIVNNINQMTKAVAKISQIDRKACRRYVQNNFDIKHMLDGYERVYKKITKEPKNKK
jgi:glycosyltransferase involved in cell wall biosynthesis